MKCVYTILNKFEKQATGNMVPVCLLLAYFCITWEGAETETNIYKTLDFPCGSDGKEYACYVGDLGFWSLGWEDSLEKGMATHCSILACKIPWTEEPGGLQSMALQRI